MVEKQDLLAKLRAAKEANNFSYQYIADATEKNGEAVSLSTVKRVLSKDAKIEDFRYETSIRPIVRVVLGIDEETEEPKEDDPSQAERYYTNTEALKSVIEVKNEMILEYKDQIKRLSRSERLYRIGFIIVVCLLAAIFSVDLALGNFGWIRY